MSNLEVVKSVPPFLVIFIPPLTPQEVRRCGRDGIDLHGLPYTSPLLGPLIAQRAHVEVHYNPDDISVAQAVHPETGAMIDLEARLPEGLLPPLSLQEWKDIKVGLTTAQQAALDRVKTPQQLVHEVMQEREQRQQKQKEAQKRTQTPKLTHLVPLPADRVTASSRIKATDIDFEDNPPSVEA